jgi:tetratricopeptide (TPR) repeat protein
VASDASSSGSTRGRRWTLAFVVLAGGAIACGLLAWRIWMRPPDRDPARLRLLQAALQEFNAGRFDRASAILDRRAAETATTPLDWMLRARVAIAQGRLEPALEALKRIPDSDPTAAQASVMAGQIEQTRHRARAAEAAFWHALTLNANLVQPHRELAYIYALQRRRAECDVQFRELARLIALDYKMAFAWGQSQYDIFDPNEAIRALVKIVEADPDDRWSRLALANNYRVTVRHDLAEATLRALPESDPDARAVRVQIALHRGDWEVAKGLAREGPADHALLNNLRGRLALQAGEPARAVEFFRAALSREPQDRDAIHGLGTALHRLHDPRAKEFLQIAAHHDEMRETIIACGNMVGIDVKVFPALGKICESLGRPEMARVWYDVALTSDLVDGAAVRGPARLRQPGGETDAGSLPRPGRGR